MEFSVIQGDITEQRADALVNAANTDVQMGGGVAGALRSAAGEAIQEEANQKPSLDLGGAVETGAYELDAEHVVHAATMELGGSASESTIRSATRNALAQADNLNCESVVCPALGCGIAGVDLETGVPYIFEEILEFEPRSLTTVEVIGYDRNSFETMVGLADEVRERHR